MKNTKILKPTNEPLELDGKMIYNEAQRAWGLLRLRKEILAEFPQLRERREKLGYKIIYSRNLEELEKQVIKIKKEVGIAPMLVWFVKE